MADLKIRLQNSTGDNLYPQASIDNLVATPGGSSVSVATLDGTGKVPASLLPSYVDDVIDLLAITETAPTTCALNDKYYNKSANNKKIYTATAANTWGETGETPVSGAIYVDTATDKIYRWSGSELIEISSQVSVRTQAAGGVRDTSSASDSMVPSELAVAQAIADATDGALTEIPIATASTVGGVTLDGTVFTTSGTSGTLVAGAISATTWSGLQTTETKLVTGGKMKSLVGDAITSATSTFISGVTAGTGISVSADGATVSLDTTNKYDLKYVLL